MNIRFESMDEVDNVRMVAETFVTSELQEVIVAGCRTSAIVGRLGQALDGHELVIGNVLGQENHTEGSMVERGNRLETRVQEHALDETILHAVHSSPIEEDTDKITESSMDDVEDKPVADQRRKPKKAFSMYDQQITSS